MASDDPNSSWHPALMPNAAIDRHVADVPSNAPSDDATTASISPLHDEPTHSSESPERQDSLLNSPERAAGPADGDVHVADQPGDEWPVFDQPAPVARGVEAEIEAPAPNFPGDSFPTSEAAHAFEDAQHSGPALGHASSVSFARTVSHEPNFHDEEEQMEFSPSHMDTDPSDFMLPTDRTNSFPPVPPNNIPDDEPLPSNQAEQVMQETENEQRDTQWIPDVDGSSQVANQQHSAEPHFAAHDFLDGDGQEPGSRFMEGVPLIPQQPAVESSADPEQASAETSGLFEAVAGGDDDFFSQIEDHGTQNAAELDAAPSLERKSTQQVLGDLRTGSLSRADTLESMPEEAENLAPEGGEALQGPTAEALVEETFAETTRDVSIAAEPISSVSAPEDLASKWQEAFAGDDGDDFLLEDSVGDSKQVDPAAFFGSDDEGFLDDEDDDTAAPQPASSAPAPAIGSTQNSQARYTPQTTPNLAQHATAKNPYAPQAPLSQSASYFPPPAATPPVPSPYGAQQMEPQQTTSPGMYGAPPPRPDISKAQSFADKNKGGYTSPYDLPMEVVKPRKRASMQHLARNTQSSNLSAPPPPRSSSMNAQASASPPPADTPSLSESPMAPLTGGISADAPLSGPPSASSLAAPSSPTSGFGGQETSSQNKSAGALKHQSSFFEDLPSTSKVRPASRQSNRMPSPAQPSPSGPPQQYLPQPASSPVEPPKSDPAVMPRSSSSDIATLVAPPRTNPYATLQTQPQAPPSLPTTSRYSPAPAQASNASLPPRPNSASRYSPMTTAAARPPVPSYNSAPPPSSTFPHQPRTSSPLAHFESSTDRAQNAALANGEPVMPERQMSSHHEPRIHRVPSLPPTHEVDEEEEVKESSETHQAGHKPYTASVASTSRYAPSSPSMARQTPPPPPAGYAPSAMSPPKRAMSNYTPQSSVNGQAPEPAHPSHQPSQAQSPGSRRQSYVDEQTAQFGARPSSSHGPMSPVAKPGLHTSASASLPIRRTRGTSQSMNMLAPTDGREKDPLQRWKGSPIIAWGISGKIATTFPKSVPRYGMGQNVPTVIRTPGEVRVRNVRDIEPLEERLATFPGPLKGKAKKKETLAWLNSGIEALEKGPTIHGVSAQQTHDEKRASERVLLWKILKAFIEFDGTLESNAQAEKAVRDILAPELSQTDGESVSNYGSGGNSFEASGPMQPDGADPSAVEQIRKHLLFGDREKAVWAAVDKRLWGHAMLISNTVSSELYKQVSQEFVRKEVNYSGHNNESLAALYKVLSGNHDDCVDELVPSHARAGLQLMDPTSATGSVRDAMAGLDKWRETLGLILSNRSHDDVSALSALGTLLSSYGRAEAAHICFLFARKVVAFGGVDDPSANFVLLGADHKTQAEQFSKEPDALLLSEVFEYGLSLAGGSMSTGLPHLAGYKLQHAVVLAEYGLRDKALAYCDVIVNSMTAQTKRSPYYHPLLETAVDDLMKRLKQSPKGESTSWISKPNLNNVSDSMWNRFNKFVAGDEADNAGTGAPAEGGVETGPFGRIAGGTPTISPSPSVSNFAVYGQSSPGYPVDTPSVSAPITRASSRYAPMAPQPNASSSPYDPTASYAPASRSANEYAQSSYQPGRSSIESQPSFLGSGVTSQPETPYGYGMAQEIPPPPPSQNQPEMQPMFETQTQVSSASPYGPHGMQEPPAAPATEAMYPNSNVINSQDGYQLNPGYQPSSHSFDPSSMNPNGSFETQSADDAAATGGYDPTSFQPYSFEPPSYNPPPETSQNEDGDAPPMPRKKGIMDDDDDDIPALRAPTEKSKAEKDKENEELFKKAAEEDAKRSAEQQAKKKGWGFTNWWGGKKEPGPPDPGQLNKPIKAKLGEESSFVYDPDLKRWVNKKAGADQTQAKTATPPPPKSAPRSHAGTPPPPSSTPPMGMGQAPPLAGPPRPGLTPSASDLSNYASQESLGGPPAAATGPPGMARSVSNISGVAGGGGPPSRPPSRPTTSMSNASSIDDLLGAAGPRKPGAKKSKRGGRYVDVMAK